MTDPDHRVRPAGALQAIALILPATLAVMAVLALAPALPLLFRTFGRTPGANWLVPMVLTLPALCLIVFSPLAGYLGDRFGRRKLLIGGLIAYSAFGLAPLLLSSLPAILISRIGVGIAEAFALTLSTTLIGDMFEGPACDRWLGYQTAVAAVSAIVFVGVGGALGGLGWRGPFAIYAAPLAFAALVAAVTWEPARRRTGASATFPWAAIMPVLPATLFTAIMFYALQIQSSVALAAKGVNQPGFIGMVLALAAMATVAGAVSFRFVLSWPTLRLLGVGFLFLTVGFVGVSQAPTVILLAVSLAIAQFGCGLLLPTAMTWAIRRLPEAVRARGTGAWQGVFSFGQFVSPILVTIIGARWGGILATFGILGGLNLVAALIAFRHAYPVGSEDGRRELMSPTSRRVQPSR